MRGGSPKGNGIVGGKLKPLEVVAICDHLVALGAAELEDEIDGKAPGVALDLLVQRLGGHAVERGEVGVDHDLVAADDHATRARPSTMRPVMLWKSERGLSDYPTSCVNAATTVGSNAPFSTPR